MKQHDNDIRWRLKELRVHAEQALAALDYSGSANGQISDVPNERALRYYTTIGLLDRPAEMRGRTAYYSWRHLLQVVATKRLQAQGLSLVDVQQRLAGRPDAALAAMAGLPVEPDLTVLNAQPTEAIGATEVEEEEELEEAVREDRRESFWMQAEEEESAAITRTVPSASNLNHLQLTSDLMVVWNGEDASASDQAALQAAAAPLLRELKRRGLLR